MIFIKKILFILSQLALKIDQEMYILNSLY